MWKIVIFEFKFFVFVCVLVVVFYFMDDIRFILKYYGIVYCIDIICIKSKGFSCFFLMYY